MCKHMVDGNEQKGHGKTTAVSEDAEAEIFITFKWKQYMIDRLLKLEKQRKGATVAKTQRFFLRGFALKSVTVLKKQQRRAL